MDKIGKLRIAQEVISELLRNKEVKGLMETPLESTFEVIGDVASEADPCLRVEDRFKKMTLKQIGSVFVELVIEANHNSWDGETEETMTGIRSLLEGFIQLANEPNRVEYPIFTGVGYATLGDDGKQVLRNTKYERWIARSNRSASE